VFDVVINWSLKSELCNATGGFVKVSWTLRSTEVGGGGLRFTVPLKHVREPTRKTRFGGRVEGSRGETQATWPRRKTGGIPEREVVRPHAGHEGTGRKWVDIGPGRRARDDEIGVYAGRA
jgi:hypothetical protein